MTAVVAAPSTVAQPDYAIFVDNGIVVVDPVAVTGMIKKIGPKLRDPKSRGLRGWPLAD